MWKMLLSVMVLLLPSAAWADFCSDLYRKQVLTAAQWNSCFASKQDTLGYVPLNKAGDTMYGRLGLVGSTTGSSGMNLGVGVTPTAPNNGDIWLNNSGLFYQNNGVTVGPVLGGNMSAALTSVNDTNITATLTGTPNSALLQAVTMTFGWSGVLAAARLNSNVVQAITNDTNITGSISAQNLTFAWAGTLSVARGGTGSGTRSTALANLMPTPTRAGDIAYWNGTAWVTIAGNNSGTQVLSENASGVPAWTAAGTGTVTSVASGAGLTGGPVTTTGSLAVSLSFLTNSLASPVNLNNISNYFDGPTVAQGTTGVWFASGNAVIGSGTADSVACKLWDGTTVVDVGGGWMSAGTNVTIALSGVFSAPASNIKISCKDITSTSGVMSSTVDSIAKASTITVFRIQ